MGKRRRNVLTLSQESSVIAKCEWRDKEGINWTLASISAWAKEHFASMIHLRILCDKDKIIAAVLVEIGVVKKKRTQRCYTLEKGLIESVWDQCNRNVSVSDELIKEKGRRLLNEVNMQLAEGQRIVLRFSGGCFRQVYEKE